MAGDSPYLRLVSHWDTGYTDLTFNLLTYGIFLVAVISKFKQPEALMGLRS